MVKSNSWLSRALALGAVASLVLAACGGTNPPSGGTGSSGPGPSGGDQSEAPSGPQAGGTLHLLTNAERWADVDPQRIYTGEDIAFFSGTIYRALESYVYSDDEAEGTTLQPDLATDLGTATDEGATWSFTLRDGITWEDGSPIVCADIAYGVSRTFATDITGGGPSYAIQYLDIPQNDEGRSQYPGPFTATPEQQALFDEAVVCDGNTITFHLKTPVADFNYTTTLGMFPMPNRTDHPGVDIGEGYGVNEPPLANGPYRVEEYSPGVGGTMTLVRNENWSKDSDTIRPAYPDSWVIHFGVDEKLLDQRLMSPSGDDEFGLQYGQVQPENLPTIFADADNPKPEFEGRAISGFDPYSRYFWVDVNKIPNEKHRQAMAVALDREAARTVLGGDFYGDYGDGVIKPNIGQDYADTGFYTDLFGEPIPPSGNVELAKRLIAESGEEVPDLKWNYADTDVGAQYFAVVQESLQEAGFTVEPGPIPPGDYYNTVFDPENELTGNFGNNGWGPDWPNASTVIAPIFTVNGGWDVSQLDDPKVNDQVDDALTTLDRGAQATKWQALNKEYMLHAYVIPTFFGRSQTIAGTKVGPIYRWSAYGSWPYGVMYAVQE
jgi:peptide/nickel transport system substrate-binding protein